MPLIACVPSDGLGASEDRLGSALAAAGPAAATAQVTTKIRRLIRCPDGEPCAPDFEAPGSVPLEERKIVNDFTAAGVRTSLSESLGRLGVEKVIPPILVGAEGLNRRPPAGSCRLFLGPGFPLGAR